MKKLKVLALVLAAVMTAGMLAACGGSGGGSPAPETEASEDTSISFTDMAGHDVTLDAVPERVVALSAADCEILFAVGAGDTLVGRGEYCDYPAEVLDLPSVQSGYETNIEQIIELDPQVVIMSSMAQSEEQVQALEEAGITCVVSEAYDIEGIYTSVRMIGRSGTGRLRHAGRFRRSGREPRRGRHRLLRGLPARVRTVDCRQRHVL